MVHSQPSKGIAIKMHYRYVLVVAIIIAAVISFAVYPKIPADYEMAIGFAILFLSIILIGLVVEKIGLANPVIVVLFILPVAMFGAILLNVACVERIAG